MKTKTLNYVSFLTKTSNPFITFLSDLTWYKLQKNLLYITGVLKTDTEYRDKLMGFDRSDNTRLTKIQIRK